MCSSRCCTAAVLIIYNTSITIWYRRRAKLNKILEDLRVLLPDSKSTTSSLLDEAIRRIQLLSADISHVSALNAQLDAEIKRLTAAAATATAPE